MINLYKIPIKNIDIDISNLNLGRIVSTLTKLISLNKNIKILILNKMKIRRKYNNKYLKIRTTKHIKKVSLKYKLVINTNFLLMKTFYNMLPKSLKKSYTKFIQHKC